jgi:hypothetical protein
MLGIKEQKHCTLLLSCLGLALDPELLYVASIAATLLFVRQGEYVAKFSVMHCRKLKINKYPGRRKMVI